MKNYYQITLLTLLGITLIALGLSYWVEYGYAIPPCRFCLWQRVIYFIIGGVVLLGLVVKCKVIILRIIQFLLLIGFFIALYHTGVAYHLFSSSCPNKQAAGVSLLWKILGQPAALYNAALSLILMIGIELAIRLSKSSKKLD